MPLGKLHVLIYNHVYVCVPVIFVTTLKSLE